MDVLDAIQKQGVATQCNTWVGFARASDGHLRVTDFNNDHFLLNITQDVLEGMVDMSDHFEGWTAEQLLEGWMESGRRLIKELFPAT
jgi:hypothetical protein